MALQHLLEHVTVVATTAQMLPLAVAGVFALLVSIVAAYYSRQHWGSRLAMMGSLLLLVWLVVTLVIFFVVGR